MLFSMNTLLINPNIIAVENIDDPPRLRSGKGIPVKGIKPSIVNKFISICTPKSINCLLYTSPSPRDAHESRMPSSA